MRSMIKLYRDDREEFEKHYHQRSRVEISILSIEEGIQQPPNIKKEEKPEKRTPIKAIKYNIEIANLTPIKEKVR